MGRDKLQARAQPQLSGTFHKTGSRRTLAGDFYFMVQFAFWITGEPPRIRERVFNLQLGGKTSKWLLLGRLTCSMYPSNCLKSLKWYSSVQIMSILIWLAILSSSLSFFIFCPEWRQEVKWNLTREAIVEKILLHEHPQWWPCPHRSPKTACWCIKYQNSLRNAFQLYEEVCVVDAM